MGKNYSHLSYNDRLKIETMYQTKHSVQEIANYLGVHPATIYRELKRGRYQHLIASTWEEEERYSPDISHDNYIKNSKKKGRKRIIQDDQGFVSFVEKKILQDKYSPYATLTYIKEQQLKFRTNICLSTLYNYIRWGVFENLEMSDLPHRNKLQTKRKKKKVQKRVSRGSSIEKRAEEIEQRNTFGHREMDTVKGPKGKSKKTLLVLSERKTRIEIIELLKDGTNKEVVKALNRIQREIGEKRFREIFKTITVDNGSEFSDCIGMEKSRRNKLNRTQIYYCHPYTSWERGTNENQNKLIRYHIPKGHSFDEYTRTQVRKIEAWINSYPRELFSGKSSADIYYNEFQEKFWRLSG